MSNHPPVSPIVIARAAHLRRGINLSHWFSQVYHKIGYTPEHFDSYMTDADLVLIKAMGFDHVRFTIAPEPILSQADAGRFPADYLTRLDGVVQKLLDLDRAVIIDIHADGAIQKAAGGR